MSRRLKVGLLAGGALLACLFLVRVRGVLTPFYFAFAIAYLGSPIVSLLEAKQVPRPLAILLLYAIFLVFVASVVYALLPSLQRELEHMLERLPETTRQLETLPQGFLSRWERRWLPASLQEAADLVIRQAQSWIEGLAFRVAQVLMGLLSRLADLVLAPFLAYYILKDRDRLAKASLSWLPTQARKDALELCSRVNKVVGRFVRGQLIVSVVVGGLVALGLSLLGVRYALFLGVLAGLFDIIPYFGPVLGAIPALVLAFLRDPLTALWTLLMFVAVQQLEGSVLSPKIVGEQVGLHPLTVIFSVLAGGELLGVTGMLLAVPAAATVKVTAGFIGEKLMAESS